MAEENKTAFKTEGEPAFPVADTETDNSADSSSDEETNTDQTQSEEGDQTPTEEEDGSEDDAEESDDTTDDTTEGGDDDGKKTEKTADEKLSDHPRWKERETDWTKRFNDQETRHLEQITKTNEGIDKRIKDAIEASGAKKSDVTDEAVPTWFGGDAEAWKGFLEWNNQLHNKSQSAALKSVNEKSEADQKLIDDATIYMNDQVKEIQESKTLNPQGVKVDRNKLFKFVSDEDLVDSKGRWNYKAAWKMMQNVTTKKTKTKIDEKKKIASASISDNRAEDKTKDFKTSTDFADPAKRPW
jgi:hypothetical protein